MALNKYTGSSTAVLASLDETGHLKTTNLGDSGYVLFTASVDQDGKVSLQKTFRSKE